MKHLLKIAYSLRKIFTKSPSQISPFSLPILRPAEFREVVPLFPQFEKSPKNKTRKIHQRRGAHFPKPPQSIVFGHSCIFGPGMSQFFLQICSRLRKFTQILKFFCYCLQNSV